jgi:hypothetical protein
MANPIAEQYAEMLLDKISRDSYPSTTHMDMLEAIAPPSVLLQFAFHLIERIQEEEHPSIPMMQRAQRLTLGFGNS